MKDAVCSISTVVRFPTVRPAALLIALLGLAQMAIAADDSAKDAARLPTLFLIGDSTVRNGTKGQVGWGDPIADLFDKSKINVRNRALGGRSSRTFLTEGLWDKVIAELRPGDFVIMQFGHNDGGPLTSAPRGVPRASIKGNGDESQEVDNPATNKKEVVRTYGWYLRKYIADTQAKGATAIVCSPIPRNMWKDGRVNRASNDYGKWAAEAAKATGAAFIDLNEIVARRYEATGQQKVQELYFGENDHTHTTAAGARVNAGCVVEGLRGLKDIPLSGFLRMDPQASPATENGRK
jgi:rhamnogalacturonan acetylesterase